MTQGTAPSQWCAVHLVLAHRDIAQIDRLIVRLLAGPSDRVVLHLDPSSGIAGAGPWLLAQHGRRLRLVERSVRVRWGHWSVVEATRRLLETALAEPFDLAHLLSGADWPVASRTRIEAEANGRCFIEAQAGTQSDRMARWRLDGHWQGPNTPNTNRSAAARRAAVGLGHALDRVAPRVNPLGPWHKGSQWWSLPRDACEHVAATLHTLARSSRLRFTACADEHAIQTIVATRWPERIAGHRRHIEWSPGAPSPAVLTRASEPALGDAWFMRKVDPTVDDFFLRYPAM